MKALDDHTIANMEIHTGIIIPNCYVREKFFRNLEDEKQNSGDILGLISRMIRGLGP